MNEIINYVMETPGNTNPNVLKGMLEKNNGGGNIKIPVIEISEENHIAFGAKATPLGDGQRIEAHIYDYGDWTNNPTPIFLKDLQLEEPVIFLGTAYLSSILYPIGATADEIPSGFLGLIKEKECLTIVINSEGYHIIKDTDGIVEGTGVEPDKY